MQNQSDPKSTTSTLERMPADSQAREPNTTPRLLVTFSLRGDKDLEQSVSSSPNRDFVLEWDPLPEDDERLLEVMTFNAECLSILGHLCTARSIFADEALARDQGIDWKADANESLDAARKTLTITASARGLRLPFLVMREDTVDLPKTSTPNMEDTSAVFAQIELLSHGYIRLGELVEKLNPHNLEEISLPPPSAESTGVLKSVEDWRHLTELLEEVADAQTSEKSPRDMGAGE